MPVEKRHIADTKIDNISPQSLASLTSLVAYGHERYDNDGDKAPKLQKTDEGTIVLEYSINPSGASIESKHCRLTISDSGVKFEVELVSLY